MLRHQQFTARCTWFLFGKLIPSYRNIAPYLTMNELATITALQQRIALYEDMRAYQELYGLLFSRLFHFSYAMVRSREAAEEIVSDVFIKLWQMRNELGKVAALKVYLYTITRNFSLNYITRNHKHHWESLEAFDEADFMNPVTPEELAISADMHQRIQEAIRQLPPQCRIIFQLVREDGLKYREVAEVLQLSVLTVRNQMSIAVRKIAAALPPSLRRQFASTDKFSRS
ncbi:RNA polymerase sigma-70 factor [Paracnuella aquatica]|nr:RNA polymerase sigma-70 factor [Paracnuella aquatica]